MLVQQTKIDCCYLVIRSEEQMVLEVLDLSEKRVTNDSEEVTDSR